MLIRDSVFNWILYNRERDCFSVINMYSIRAKRGWAKKPDEEKAALSLLRSKIAKKVFAKYSPESKKYFFSRTSEAKQEFWDNISAEDKEKHIAKMSSGMKKAWDNADENFGPKLAHERNIKNSNGHYDVKQNCKRINDYAGVITLSDMDSL